MRVWFDRCLLLCVGLNCFVFVYSVGLLLVSVCLFAFAFGLLSTLVTSVDCFWLLLLFDFVCFVLVWLGRLLLGVVYAG